MVPVGAAEPDDLAAVRATLDAFAQPAALIDAGARLLYANAVARGLGIGRRTGEASPVHVLGAGCSRGLEASLHAAITGALEATTDAPEPLYVRGHDAQLPASLLSIRRIDCGDRAPGPVLLVRFYDARQRWQPSVSWLSLLYDLTPREASIAVALAEGAGLAVAAGRLGLSLNTVRAHARAVFRKLGVNSQARLAHVLATAVPGSAPAGDSRGRPRLVRSDESKKFTQDPSEFCRTAR